MKGIIRFIMLWLVMVGAGVFYHVYSQAIGEISYDFQEIDAETGVKQFIHPDNFWWDDPTGVIANMFPDDFPFTEIQQMNQPLSAYDFNWVVSSFQKHSLQEDHPLNNIDLAFEADVNAIQLFTTEYSDYQFNDNNMQYAYVLDNQMMLDSDFPVSDIETKRSFFAAPNQEEIELGYTIWSFLPKSSELETLINISVDFDDGKGERNLLIGLPVKILYETPGEKVWKISTEIDGKTVTSYSTILVKAENQNAELVYPPDRHIELASNTRNVNLPAGMKVWDTGLEMGVYYACGRSRIERPFVIVEGIDFDNSRNLYTTKSYNSLYAMCNENGLADKLRDNGFDVVIVNFWKGATAIQNNAFALIEALEWLKSELLVNQSEHKILLSGVSMGGVVTRFALAYCEFHNLDHYVDVWLSFDAPHKGAHLPTSLQLVLKEVHDRLTLFNSKLVETAKKQLLDGLILAPATKQLLSYHIYGSKIDKDKKVLHPLPHSNAEQLEQVFQAFGNNGFPQSTFNISVSNGSKLGYTSNMGSTTLLASGDGKKGIKEVRLAHKDKAIHVLHSNYNLDWLRGIFNVRLYSDYKCLPIKPWFNANGGSANFQEELFDFNIRQSPKLFPGINPDFKGLLGIDWVNSTPTTFIPTYSAFYLYEPNDPIQIAISSIESENNRVIQNARKYSPFDVLIASETNLPHVIGGISPSLIDDILNRAVGGNKLILQNKTIHSNGSQLVNGDILMGNFVDPILKQGPVIFEENTRRKYVSGTKIQLSNGVHLKSGTRVSLQVNPSEYTLACRDQGILSDGMINHLEEELHNSPFTKPQSNKQETTVMNEEMKGELLIYPTLVRDYLRIESTGSVIVPYEIHSIRGDIVKAGTCESGEINCEQLANGQYIISCFKENGEVSQHKFIKQ